MKIIILAALVVAGLATVFFWPQKLTDSTSQDLSTNTEPENRPTVEKENLPTNFTVIAGGDVMFARYMETNLRRFGSSWPFANVKNVIGDADLALANLESPFLINGSQTPNSSLIMRGHPLGAESLKDAGFDYLSLANNHIPDMGLRGIADTKQLLTDKGMKLGGAGISQNEADSPTIIEIKGQKIGILSFTYGTNFNKPGVFYVLANPEKASVAVKELKTKVEIVLVTVHFGQEYQALPNTTQKNFAHAVIDAGATAVFGAHPHVSQPVEVYNKGVIFYSLGNLVFDQAPGANRDVSALAKLNFVGKNLASIELIPYHIYNLGQPKIVSGAEADRIFGLFDLLVGKKLIYAGT